jgi:hypothetical protein
MKMSEQHDPKTGKFLPGHSPTPGGGRPAGTRNRLTTLLLNSLVADFEQFGPAAVKIMRVEKPSEYVKVIASLVPKELLVQESALSEMSDDELVESLAIIRRLKTRAAAALVEQIEQKPDETTKH